LLKLIFHTSAAEFLDTSGAFLLRNEIANCVMLGSALRIRDKVGKHGTGTYFASMQSNGETCAVAFFSPTRPLQLTSMSPAMLELLIYDMRQRNLTPSEISSDAQTAREFAVRWSEINKLEYIEDHTFRVYQLQKLIPPKAVVGRLRVASPADVKLVAEWAEAFDTEVEFGDAPGIRDLVLLALQEQRMYVWDVGGPVCMLMRNAPTPNAERVSVVYTPPEQRGKGYGAAANAALAQIILDSGKRYACLFSEVRNPISNKMYVNIGYEVVCDVYRYKFLVPA
jgi:uncharacterized protein